LTKDGLTYLNDSLVNINDLQKAITQKFGNAKGVYVRADKETIWESLAQVVSMLGQAGLQVNMVTQPEDTAVKRR
jgi:biopolymer transport protein ExbD